MKPIVTQSRLREMLSYNEITGEFTRVKKVVKHIAGSVAGCVCPSKGYIKICIDGRTYMAHRLAWFYLHGAWPTDSLDHVNGIRADNRICNLREATNSENHQNRTCNRNSKSGLLGVSWHKSSKTWRASIKAGNKHYHIGHFHCPDMAYAAYQMAKAELHTFSPMVRRDLTNHQTAGVNT